MSQDDLQNLYREQVLHHSRNPVHRRVVDDATCVCEGNNPLCGDKLTVYLTLNDTTVSDVSFEGSGCAISVASASMMSDMLSGVSRDEATSLLDDVLSLFAIPAEQPAMLASQPDAPVTALGAVRRYPSRIKCATLAWHAAASVIAGNNNTTTVSTE
ncbi:MAG: Fe-S cluster assembly sulfur transfer protein SufU [Pseudomonadota bacterium]